MLIVSHAQDPSYYQTNLQKEFMFAVGIQDLDLSSNYRYFDLVMTQRQYNSSGRITTIIPLYQCNLTDWQQQSFQKDFNSLNLSQWYCPKSNSTMRFQGKFTSPSFKFYKISVKRCDPSLDLSRPCIDNITIDNYVNANAGYKLNFYFVSPLLNPGNQKYISNYVRDGNYFTFTPTSGVSANLYLSHYYIQSDNSLLPYEDIHVDQGGIVQGQIQNFKFDVIKNEYVRLYLRKATVKINITRSFQKADQTLSYVGGLFSSVLTMLFLVSMYNQLCYQLQITKNVYHPSKSTPIDSDSFNFITFLGYLIYSSLQKINIQLPWQKMRIYHFYLESVKNQIDIRLILKKFVYFQRVTQALLNAKQIKTLHMRQPSNLDEAMHIRRDIKILNQLKKKKHINQQKRQKLSEHFQTQQYIDEQKKTQNFLFFILGQHHKVHPIIQSNQNTGQKIKMKKQCEKIQLVQYKQKQSKNDQKKINNQNNLNDSKQQINLEINDENDNQFQTDYKQSFDQMKNCMRELYTNCLKGNKIAIKIMNGIDKEIRNIFLNQSNQNDEEQNDKKEQDSKNE